MVEILTQPEYDSTVETLAEKAILKLDSSDLDSFDLSKLADNHRQVVEIVADVVAKDMCGELGWVNTTNDPSAAFYGSIIDCSNKTYVHSDIESVVDEKNHNHGAGYRTDVKAMAIKSMTTDVFNEVSGILRSERSAGE